MKNTFDLLEQYSRFSLDYRKSDEMAFFMRHRDMLVKSEQLAYLYDGDASDFLMIRANIIIYSLLNKLAIEKTLKDLAYLIEKDQVTKFRIDFKEQLEKLPCYSSKMNRIYVAFFSKAINLMYLTSPEDFLQFPFNQLKNDYSSSIIDAFDVYGAELFDSVFTRLVRIQTHGKEIAYYHYDFKTLYFVNEQGRLDAKVCLFDKYLEDFDLSNMVERLVPVCDAYYNNDRSAFIENLLKNKLISEKMVRIVESHRNRRK